MQDNKQSWEEELKENIRSGLVNYWNNRSIKDDKEHRKGAEELATDYILDRFKQLLTSKAEQMEKIEEWNESYCKEDENLLLEIKKEILEILKK